MTHYGKFRTQKECYDIARKDLGKCTFKGKAYWLHSAVKSYYYESGRGNSKRSTYVAYADYQ